MGQLIVSEEASNAPTPPSGFGSLFAKTDHHLYWKRPDGTLAQIDTGAGNILLQNNSTNNSSQTTLNLVAGANVTLTDGGGGAITIASTGGGGSTSIGLLLAVINNTPFA
jgi:hypothetical protein